MNNRQEYIPLLGTEAEFSLYWQTHLDISKEKSIQNHLIKNLKKTVV